MRTPIGAVLALVAMLALSAQHSNAQVLFGSMVGNVTDASGAAVPGAHVKITATGTNEVRNADTNEAGNYTISTVTAGTYQVEIAKTGFRGFVTNNILVNQNNVVRVDAQLQVGQQSEMVEVTAEAAALQTDRADVHAEVAAQQFEALPQPNRSYEGLLALVPGTTPPGGQLSGGTNNPSKSMQFSFNGTGVSAATVRIEGVSAMNPWVTNYTTFVPSIEAIQNVNVATSAADAEQGLSGGASVNVSLKSGSNQTHGAAFGYNIIAKFEANNFFANAAGIPKPPHLVNNNTGGSLGGHVIKDKLFYFGSYEGDYANQADSGVLSIPAATQLRGDFTGSANEIYDPTTGAANGTGRNPFPGKLIPASRVNPITAKMLQYFPATNLPGVNNNYYLNRPTVYNLHKIDTKVDYTASQKLRLSGRWGYQPYYNFQAPIYGEFLGGSGGFPQSGAGNYLQNGATLAISGSGTYVFSPSFVVDATFGITQAHQLLFPNKTNERVGSDTLGIPGTNKGLLP
ncbi:MAG TPA: carboxypeptidase-like regulatory domain-containing protein, partial [Bryobacteraceae bacterium]|nr:carboxypeptidase-like regulatory domain-containing protein [Bryobacteraceae bacterium]